MMGASDRHDHCAPERKCPTFRFAYACLQEKGFVCFRTGRTKLVLTFRGTGMIDGFDRGSWMHIAFLDFDIRREIHLDSAFGSPLIGLPFSADLGRTMGISLHRFDDLRQHHHYGFFVHPNYRNKGREGVWNLDELMMAIALAYAEAHHLQWFHIKPTGDTTAYYRRKYGATRLPTTAADKISSIRLLPDRQPLPHVHLIRNAGGLPCLDVQTASDDSWPSG
jgi:GNAT superfamily N-acetyltransferase